MVRFPVLLGSVLILSYGFYYTFSDTYRQQIQAGILIYLCYLSCTVRNPFTLLIHCEPSKTYNLSEEFCWSMIDTESYWTGSGSEF